MPINPFQPRQKRSALDTIATAVNMAGTAAGAAKNISDLSKSPTPTPTPTQEATLEDMADQWAQTQQPQPLPQQGFNPNPLSRKFTENQRPQVQRFGGF